MERIDINLSKETQKDKLIEKVEKEINKVQDESVAEKSVDLNAIWDAIASLKAQVEEKDKIIDKQNEAIKHLAETKTESIASGETIPNSSELVDLLKAIKDSSTSREIVKVIHLDNCYQTQLKLTNGNILTFKQYGEVMPISIIDAELLVNQYTETFRRGALTLDNEHLYMLEEKGIDVKSINHKPYETFEKFHELSDEEIKTMYKGLAYFQKEMLKSYIVNKIKQDKFNEVPIAKIRLLNKLSKDDTFNGKGGYEYIIEKLSEIEK